MPYTRVVVPDEPLYMSAKTYTADDDRKIIQDITTEGPLNGGDFQVTFSTGRTFIINQGVAFVDGKNVADQGTYRVRSAVNNSITVAAGDATNPRLDQIVLRVLDNPHDGSGAAEAAIEVIPGTPTAGATLDNRNGAASLTGGLDQNSTSLILLADVLVPAGASTLSGSNLRDKRTLFGLKVGGLIQAKADGNVGAAVKIGNDAELHEIDEANTFGIKGAQDATQGGFKLGSDVYVQRIETDVLRVTGVIRSRRFTTTQEALGLYVDGDNNRRLQIDASGKIEWGPGNAAVDVNLFRALTTGASVAALKTDDIFLGRLLSCKGTRNAVQSLTTSVQTEILWNTEAWDDDTMHDTSTNTGRIVCKTAGRYRATGYIEYASNGTGIRSAHLKVTGTEKMRTRVAPASGSVTGVPISGEFDMAANDYFTLDGFQDSGGNLDVNTQSFLSVTRIG